MASAILFCGVSTKLWTPNSQLGFGLACVTRRNLVLRKPGFRFVCSMGDDNEEHDPLPTGNLFKFWRLREAAKENLKRAIAYKVLTEVVMEEAVTDHADAVAWVKKATKTFNDASETLQVWESRFFK